MTLRYPYEVRKEEDYFDEIPDEKIPKDMLDLATHIVQSKIGHFDQKKFDDRYEDALKELLNKKRAGQRIEAPKEPAPAKVINLMDALRRSVETDRQRTQRRIVVLPKSRVTLVLVIRRRARGFWIVVTSLAELTITAPEQISAVRLRERRRNLKLLCLKARKSGAVYKV
jgi:hypothetical protein